VSVTLNKLNSDSGLAYHRSGQGPVLLLVHGVGLMSESWYQQLDSLHNDFDIIAVDLPGHGLSEPLATTFEEVSLSHYVEAINNFISEVHGGRYYLSGHSLGALISIELAARFSDRVLGLAALNTIFQRSAEALLAVQSRARLLNDSIHVVGVQQTLDRWFTPAPDVRNRWYSDLCRTWLTKNDKDAYAFAYKTFADTAGPNPNSLQKICCPSVFITGDLDANSNQEMTLALSKSVNLAKSRIIKGAAHMMPLTHAESVCEELRTLKSANDKQLKFQHAR